MYIVQFFSHLSDLSSFYGISSYFRNLRFYNLEYLEFYEIISSNLKPVEILEWETSHGNIWLVSCALRHSDNKTPKEIQRFIWNNELFYDFYWSSGFRKVKYAMWNAARNGKLNVIDFLIESGSKDWEYGLCGAFLIGNPNLVNFFLKKGAVKFNWALYFAAYGGHTNIVDFFLAKGANKDEAIYWAKKSQNLSFLLHLIGTNSEDLRFYSIQAVDEGLNKHAQSFAEKYNYLITDMSRLATKNKFHSLARDLRACRKRTCIPPIRKRIKRTKFE